MLGHYNCSVWCEKSILCSVFISQIFTIIGYLVLVNCILTGYLIYFPICFLFYFIIIIIILQYQRSQTIAVLRIMWDWEVLSAY